MRLAKLLCSTAALCSLLAASAGGCGVAHRSSQYDSGPADRDGGQNEASDSGVLSCPATCTSLAVQAEAYSASGSETELFSVVQPSGGSFASTLVKVELADGTTTDIVDLPSASPERSGLLLHEGWLYWTDSQDNDGDVARINPVSGALVVIATDQARPSTPVANSTSIYWGVHGGVMRYDKGTMVVTLMHSFEPTARVGWVAATDDELLYRADTRIHRLKIVDGVTTGNRTELVQTIRPIGLHAGRFYYQVPSSISSSGDDEVMSMPSTGGVASLEAQEDDMSEPTLLPGGDLLWFASTTTGLTLVRQDGDGAQTVQLLTRALVSQGRWIFVKGPTLVWLAGTILTLLSADNCECET